MQESRQKELDRLKYNVMESLATNSRSMQEAYDKVLQELKPKINAMCYVNVPESMTIKEFEDLTVSIFKLIDDEWQKKLPADT